MATDPFAGRLLARETMRWSGRPRQGLMLTARDAFLIPFSMLWGGFAIFWEAEALLTNAPWFMALWGVPFVVVGLFIIFGRLPFDAWLRRRVFYALTDRRVLILRESPWGSFKAVALDRLSDATLTEGSGGRDTIRFAPPTALWGGVGNGASFWLPALDPTAQFLGIDDVRRVFAMVQEHAQAGTADDRRPA